VPDEELPSAATLGGPFPTLPIIRA